MKPLLAGLALILMSATAAWADEPKAWIHDGDVWFAGADGAQRRLTTDGQDRDAVLSPDGRQVAYVHVDAPPPGDYDPDRSSLWLASVDGAAPRRLAEPVESDQMEQGFISLNNPVFSPDGATLYVLANAWVTSDAVHAVDLASGRQRYVIDGNSVGVLLNGPYRGWLVVSRHRYWPKGGSYDPYFVVRPDAKKAFMVPRTDRDDSEAALAAWLKAKGWRMS